jgi:hypothetical protein
MSGGPNSFRKIFIDSRLRSAGTHGNFTIELPEDVDTSHTSSVFVSSLSFSNTFPTVMRGVNNTIYLLINEKTVVTDGVNDRLYGLLTIENKVAAFWFRVPPGTYSGAELAAALQELMQQYDPDKAGATVTYTNGQIVFNNPNRRYLFPSQEQLRSSTWKASTWDPADTLVRKDYTSASTQDLNGTLRFPSATGLGNPIYATPATRFALAIPLPEGQYTGSRLCEVLQSAIQYNIRGTVVVTLDESVGRITFAFNQNVWMVTGEDLRNKGWKSANWDSYSTVDYSLSNPKDFNSQLNLPSSTFALGITTGVVDLLPFREVFLHSSLTNFHTLKATGEKDCLVRIPIEGGYGETINFRNFGGAENAIAASDKHFRQLTWTLRDWQGNVIPMQHPVSLEICFIDSDPFTL